MDYFMINFAVINLKSLTKNLIKIIFLLAFAFGIINIGENFSFKINKFDYVKILKSNLTLKEVDTINSRKCFGTNYKCRTSYYFYK